MSAQISSKIKNLLATTPQGVVIMSSWLVSKGYSLELQKRYRKSQWLESIGNGAVIRFGDRVDYLGGLYALQVQAKRSVHVGGRTALYLSGNAHYLDMAIKRAILFGCLGQKLPLWFKSYNWGVRLDYYCTNFLPNGMGLIDLEQKNFCVKISSPIRAVMECLYLAPQHQELFECYEVMEGLNNVQPQLVQELLENCASIKVKRLFLYLAEKFAHPWWEFINVTNINLGSGVRSLVKSGVYIKKYKITVPKEFEKNERPQL